MKVKLILACFVIASFIFISCDNKERIIYVDANKGSDSNQGTINKPLKSVKGARNFLRKKKNNKQDQTVILRGGTYFFNETLLLEEQDGGKGDQKIIYKAAKGEEPIITSGIKVDGWQKINEKDSIFFYLPENAKNQVMVADIPEQAEGMVRMLYDYDGEWLSPGMLQVGDWGFEASGLIQTTRSLPSRLCSILKLSAT